MTDIINEEENTTPLPEEEQETVVVDNGQTYVSGESAIIAQQAAQEAKLWAEESEAQANVATRGAEDAAQAKDDAVAAKNDAVAAKEYAEAAVTDANVVAVGTDLRARPSNIKTVASNISDVTTVAGISSNVTTVAGNTTNINTVAGVSSNVTTVATNISNVNNVSSISSDVTTVSGISSDVTAVAGNATDISAVAADLTNIDAVAADLTNIDNASANAQLARDWAVKMDGLVSGEDYSAKYYANQARQSAAGSIYTAGVGIDITNDVISVADPVLKNTATGNTSLTIGSSYPTSASTAINIGELSQAVGNLGTAVGYYSYAQSQGTALGYRATANTTASVAVGTQAYANGTGSIQIGKGTNSNNYSLSVGFNNSNNYQLLDGTTGLIPDARISGNFAQTADVVHLTGTETITGNKTFTDFTHYKTDIAYDETPATNKYGGFNFVDKNGTEINAFYSALYSSGAALAGINLKNKSGEQKTLGLRYDTSGTFYTEAPASDVNNSIVTTVSKTKASTGYFKLGNGLIIQWGASVKSTAGSNNLHTITFPSPFSTGSYFANATLVNGSSQTDSWGEVINRSSTSCDFVVKKDYTFTWIAIGY